MFDSNFTDDIEDSSEFPEKFNYYIEKIFRTAIFVSLPICAYSSLQEKQPMLLQYVFLIGVLPHLLCSEWRLCFCLGCSEASIAAALS